MLSERDEEDFKDFEDEVDRVTRLVGQLARGELDAPKIQQSDLSGRDKESKIALKTFNASRITPSKIPTKVEDKPSKRLPDSANSMSQEAFMKMIEEDASRRAKDREERNARAQELMKKGNVAFKGGNLEEALCLYNEAIDVRRDSSLLYTNRAVTHLRLSQFSKTVSDCDLALKLKDSLKARLLKAKSLREMKLTEEYESLVVETKKKFPADCPFIQGMINIELPTWRMS